MNISKTLVVFLCFLFLVIGYLLPRDRFMFEKLKFVLFADEKEYQQEVKTMFMRTSGDFELELSTTTGNLRISPIKERHVP